MATMRRCLALILTIALFITAMPNAGFAEPAGASANAAGPAASAPASDALAPEESGEPVTWAQGAKFLSGLLGYLAEDGADIDLTAYADVVTGLSAEDDSLYLGILAANGYLSGVQTPVDPQAVLPRGQLRQLVSGAFPEGVRTEADAAGLGVTSEIKNLAVSGDGLSLCAISAERIAVSRTAGLTLSAAKAAALSVSGEAKLYLTGTELQRVLIAAGGDEAVGLHVDSATKLPEIAIQGAGDVVIEGNGALGVVRVLGKVRSLTVRATCSVVNETEAEIAVTGPDGEACLLARAARRRLR